MKAPSERLLEFRLVERIDHGQPVGEPVGQTAGDEAVGVAATGVGRKAIFDRAACRHGCPRSSSDSRPGSCRPCRHRRAAPRHSDGTARIARASRAAGAPSPTRVALRAQDAPLAARELEFADFDAHGDAGPAIFACRAIGDRLRASKSRLGQSVIEGGRAQADEMRENLSLRASRQIGARGRRCEVELWRVAEFFGHARLDSCLTP